ncbi:MAG: polysaccharide pyruvyl transferase family protein [Prevotella sp.]|nr:polysaccharide pyruvyl transferase family protein [Prevotella sp.]
MKNIILANAPEYNGNLGCVALCYSMLYLIDEIFSESGETYRLYLTDSNARQRRNEVKILGKTIRYETVSNPAPASLKNAIKKILLLSETLRGVSVFRKADGIMDIGQGDSFSDIYGMVRFKRIDSIHRTARYFGKPYCFLPQTIGPFKSKEASRLSSESIRKAAVVMARDARSCQYVREHVAEQKQVDEYIDVAFLLPYQKQSFDPRLLHVGLNVSALLWNGGYTGDNQFGLKDDYQKIVREIIAFFLKKDDVVVHLIPHVISPLYNIEDDSSVCTQLLSEFRSERLVKAPDFSSPIDAKSYISGMDFFLGARMHSTIAAFSAGVPVVPMAYSRKFNGLYIETLGYPTIADLQKDDVKEILQVVETAFDSRMQLKEDIRKAITDKVEGRILRLKNDLAAFLHLKR